MPTVLTEADVRSVLTMPDLIAAMKGALIQAILGSGVQARSHLHAIACVRQLER